MHFEDLLSQLSPERYEILKRSVELGKWPDGRLLGKEEKESALQVLIAWDCRHKSVEERIGYVPTPDATQCDDDHTHEEVSHGAQLIIKQA